MSKVPIAPASELGRARTIHLPIETPSLLLRPLVPEDAAKVFRMSQEKGMQDWIPSQVYRDAAHAASVLDYLIAQYDAPADPRLGPYVLGVQLGRSGELVGHVGLSPFDEAVEVGFAVEDAHQRKGIATEAVRAVCHWATDVFALETILGIAAAQNVASQRVLARAGFAWQSDRVMRFQGSEQPVSVFAFSATH